MFVLQLIKMHIVSFAIHYQHDVLLAFRRSIDHMSFNNPKNYPTNQRVVRRKRKLKKRAYFIIIPLILLLSVGGFATYLYVKAESALSDSHVDDGRKKSDLRDDIVDPKIDNVSILLMGVDSNEKRRENNDSQLTDSLMLATLNKDDGNVKLLSIPRDSYVYIPEVDRSSKITHAHGYGGPQATVDTVENLLDIPVDYWVKVNFDAFIEVVDALNGIETDVPYEFQESDSNDKRDAIHLYPGEQELNGEEALALARTRKHDNDIERGKRQQEIIKAAMKKATSVSSVLKIDNIIDAVGSNMKTNMKFGEMKSFISYGLGDGGIDMDFYSLDGHDFQPDGTYYYQLDEEDLEEKKKMLREQLNLSDSDATVDQESSDYDSVQSAAGDQ